MKHDISHITINHHGKFSSIAIPFDGSGFDKFQERLSAEGFDQISANADFRYFRKRRILTNIFPADLIVYRAEDVLTIAISIYVPWLLPIIFGALFLLAALAGISLLVGMFGFVTVVSLSSMQFDLSEKTVWLGVRKKWAYIFKSMIHEAFAISVVDKNHIELTAQNTGSRSRHGLGIDVQDTYKVEQLDDVQDDVNKYIRSDAETQYAQHWVRAAAFVIDIALIALALYGIIVFLYSAVNHFAVTYHLPRNQARDMFAAILKLLLACVPVLYWAKTESSAAMASVGKRIMKIYVLKDTGERLTTKEALVRSISKFASLITVVGGVMPLFTRKHKALQQFPVSPETA